MTSVTRQSSIFSRAKTAMSSMVSDNKVSQVLIFLPNASLAVGICGAISLSHFSVSPDSTVPSSLAFSTIFYRGRRQNESRARCETGIWIRLDLKPRPKPRNFWLHIDICMVKLWTSELVRCKRGQFSWKCKGRDRTIGSLYSEFVVFEFSILKTTLRKVGTWQFVVFGVGLLFLDGLILHSQHSMNTMDSPR